MLMYFQPLNDAFALLHTPLPRTLTLLHMLDVLDVLAVLGQEDVVVGIRVDDRGLELARRDVALEQDVELAIRAALGLG